MMTLRQRLAHALKIVQLDHTVPPLPNPTPEAVLAWHREQDRLIVEYVDAIMPIIDRERPDPKVGM